MVSYRIGPPSFDRQYTSCNVNVNSGVTHFTVVSESHIAKAMIPVLYYNLPSIQKNVLALPKYLADATRCSNSWPVHSLHISSIVLNNTQTLHNAKFYLRLQNPRTQT